MWMCQNFQTENFTYFSILVIEKEEHDVCLINITFCYVLIYTNVHKTDNLQTVSTHMILQGKTKFM